MAEVNQLFKTLTNTSILDSRVSHILQSLDSYIAFENRHFDRNLFSKKDIAQQAKIIFMYLPPDI